MMSTWNNISILTNKNANTLYSKLNSSVALEQGITKDMTEYEAFKIYSILDTVVLHKALVKLQNLIYHKALSAYHLDICNIFSTPSMAISIFLKKFYPDNQALRAGEILILWSVGITKDTFILFSH